VIDHGLAREGKTQAHTRRLARGYEGLEEPAANFRCDPWAGVAYLNQNRVELSGRANVDGSSIGHDILRIHQQINEHPMDTIEIHRDLQPIWNVLNNLDRLRLSTVCNSVYGIRCQLTKVGKLGLPLWPLCIGLRTPRLIAACG
jgi:hypothetical protein